MVATALLRESDPDFFEVVRKASDPSIPNHVCLHCVFSMCTGLMCLFCVQLNVTVEQFTSWDIERVNYSLQDAFRLVRRMDRLVRLVHILVCVLALVIGALSLQERAHEDPLFSIEIAGVTAKPSASAPAAAQAVKSASKTGGKTQTTGKQANNGGGGLPGASTGAVKVTTKGLPGGKRPTPGNSGSDSGGFEQSHKKSRLGAGAPEQAAAAAQAASSARFRSGSASSRGGGLSDASEGTRMAKKGTFSGKAVSDIDGSGAELSGLESGPGAGAREKTAPAPAAISARSRSNSSSAASDGEGRTQSGRKGQAGYISDAGKPMKKRVPPGKYASSSDIDADGSGAEDTRRGQRPAAPRPILGKGKGKVAAGSDIHADGSGAEDTRRGQRPAAPRPILGKGKYGAVSDIDSRGQRPAPRAAACKSAPVTDGHNSGAECVRRGLRPAAAHPIAGKGKAAAAKKGVTTDKGKYLSDAEVSGSDSGGSDMSGFDSDGSDMSGSDSGGSDTEAASTTHTGSYPARNLFSKPKARAPQKYLDVHPHTKGKNVKSAGGMQSTVNKSTVKKGTTKKSTQSSGLSEAEGEPYNSSNEGAAAVTLAGYSENVCVRKQPIGQQRTGMGASGALPAVKKPGFGSSAGTSRSNSAVRERSDSVNSARSAGGYDSARSADSRSGARSTGMGAPASRANVASSAAATRAARTRAAAQATALGTCAATASATAAADADAAGAQVSRGAPKRNAGVPEPTGAADKGVKKTRK
jgi:hypothetical protein